MTLIVIEFVGVNQNTLFRDERLGTIQHLLAQGCYGDITCAGAELASTSLWDLLSPVIEDSHWRGVAGATEGAREVATGFGSSGACGYLHVSLTHASANEVAAGADGLATLLAQMGEEDVLALIAAHPSNPGYVIVSANNPLYGPSAAATVSDLALTLLALAGRQRPDSITGAALFSGPATHETDEEAELRERFRGLGYIA
jgi:hypothetical protein